MPDDDMVRLILVRHGQAVCNVEGTIEGVATCRGLSTLGLQQADLLAARLARERVRVAAVHASPIRRARETAERVVAALGVGLVLDDDLEEVRPGDAEGMTWDQYTAYYGSTEGWEPSVPFAPGAEAWSDFAVRVSGVLDRLIAAALVPAVAPSATARTMAGGEPDPGPTTVLVVAHGGVVDASIFHFFRLDPTVRSPIDFQTRNASITEWERRTFVPPGDDPVHRWRLVRYNDAAHLETS